MQSEKRSARGKGRGEEEEEEEDQEELGYGLMQPSTNSSEDGGDNLEEKKQHHFSRWGPSRPQHSMYRPRYRKRNSLKKTPCWRCICHPLTMTCTCILITMSMLAVIGAMVTLSYYADGDFVPEDAANVTYGPGDMQKLFFSPIFCEKLTPTASSLYAEGYNQSHLYLLSQKPTLTGKNNITFQDQAVVFDRHYQRNFHFRPNSVIAFEVCVKNNATYSGFGTFYLVKGMDVYDRWKESDESTPESVKSLEVRTTCEEEERQKFSYKVTQEDQYFLVFVDDKKVNPQPSEVVFIYSIQRALYEIDKSAVEDSCSFNTSSPCSVRVPFKTTAALLVYGAPVNWESSWGNAAIDVNCQLRVWFYVLLSVAGTLLVVAATACLCVSCCCCGHFISKVTSESNEPLLSQHTANLYDGRSEEMHNPSSNSSPAAGAGESVGYRVSHPKAASSSPYPPPSFKASGKFSLGSPTCETFTNQ